MSTGRLTRACRTVSVRLVRSGAAVGASAALLAACSAGVGGSGATSVASQISPGRPAATATHSAWSASFLATPVRTRAGYHHGLPVVYVTFDDGPSPLYTEAVLRVLARHRAKATFFVVGRFAAQFPWLVRDEIAAGHAVGNHSWTHPRLPTLSRAAVGVQLSRTQELIRTLGAPDRCFRPPFGQTSRDVLSVAASLNLHQYLWTTESKDWTHATTAADLDKALAGLTRGAVVAHHDGTARQPC